MMLGKPKVYLAGPISGLTYGDAQSWRTYAKDKLAPEINGFSPLRCKEYLTGFGVLEQSYEDTPLSTDRGITTRDRWDCKTSDVILCNLLDVERISIGTAIEIGWADAFGVPVVLAIAKSGSVHDHPMIRELVGFRTDNLDQAIQITKSILLPH